MLETEKKHGRKFLMFEDFVPYGDKLLFVARDANAVCSLDIGSQTVDFLDMLPEGGFTKYRLSSKISVWRNKLIFAPLRAEKIWIYDIEARAWHGIEIRQTQMKYMTDKFFQLLEYKDKLFMIGSNYPSIICMDAESEKLVYYDGVFDELKKLKDQNRDCFVRCDYVQMGSVFYMAACCSNKVLRFDMESCEYSWLSVGGEGNRYSGIAWDGEKFWLSPRLYSPVVIWDGGNNWKELSLGNAYNGGKYSFLGITALAGRMIMPGMQCEHTLIIDAKEHGSVQSEKEQYTFLKRYDDETLLGQRLNGELVLLDQNGGRRCFLPHLETEKLEAMLEKHGCRILDSISEECYKENGLLDLSVICSELMKEDDGHASLRENNTYGARIWEAVIRSC